jgi:CheY-like chemotaxis protein
MSELLASREAAVSASRARSGFLASVSHELRTPIAAILGYLDLLREDPALSRAGESTHQAFAAIDRNSRFLVQLIDDILESAQIEKGTVSIAQEPVDMRVLTADVVAGLQPLADAKGLMLHCHVDDSVAEVIESDSRRLRQILQHLLGNALKFTHSGEVRLQLSVERSAQGASTLGMVVSDTGIGIPPEEHRRIFEPFAQVDSSRSKKVGGIGLGLSIVERIVQGLSGSVELESGEGAGSRFSVRIPLRGESTRDASAPVVESATLARPCRILLAEDSPDNQLLLARLLRGAGAEVVVVSDGQAAVQALVTNRERFDLVLMDMQMPILDGYFATTLAREAGVATPIIALTAHAAAGERERCLAAGCDDYATKPIRRAELLAVVSDWLTKTSRESVAPD